MRKCLKRKINNCLDYTVITLNKKYDNVRLGRVYKSQTAPFLYKDRLSFTGIDVQC